ncbi:MAG: hypothetical protein M5U26_30000 [Planctomycetota bacterium]|nr:hypothetical protein [Planctomycetota bacterium]
MPDPDALRASLTVTADDVRSLFGRVYAGMRRGELNAARQMIKPVGQWAITRIDEQREETFRASDGSAALRIVWDAAPLTDESKVVTFEAL